MTLSQKFDASAQITPAKLSEWFYDTMISKAQFHSSWDQADKDQNQRLIFLMNAGADPNWTVKRDGVTSSHENYTLAMAAAYTSKIENLEILAAYNANFNGRDTNEKSALQYALTCAEDPHYRDKAIACAEFITQHIDAAIEHELPHLNTPSIIHAASVGATNVVKFFVDHNIDVDLKNTGGETALVAAALRGHLDTVSYLLDAGANARWVSQTSQKTLSELTVLAAGQFEHGKEIAEMVHQAANSKPARKPNAHKPK